ADVLLQASDELGAALVVATHDPAIGSRMSTVWPIHDGHLHRAKSALRGDQAGDRLPPDEQADGDEPGRTET
ncbi:MAG: hypothetical protein ACRDVG_06395, partial [Jatrophihabitantaceae bacterium]